MIPFPYQAGGAGMVQQSSSSLLRTAWDPSRKTASVNLSGGNLIASEGVSTLQQVCALYPKTSGKWYVEIVPIWLNFGPIDTLVGLTRADATVDGNFTTGQKMHVRPAGTVWAAGSGATTGTGTSFATGDVMGIAFDADNARLFIAKNNTYMNSGNPAAGTGALFSGFTISVGWAVSICIDNSTTANQATLNAGASAFVYAPPAGFSAWTS